MKLFKQKMQKITSLILVSNQSINQSHQINCKFKKKNKKNFQKKKCKHDAAIYVFIFESFVQIFSFLSISGCFKILKFEFRKNIDFFLLHSMTLIVFVVLLIVSSCQDLRVHYMMMIHQNVQQKQNKRNEKFV